MIFEIKSGSLTPREKASILKMLEEGKNMVFDTDKTYKETDRNNNIHYFKIGTKYKYFEYRLVSVYFHLTKKAA